MSTRAQVQAELDRLVGQTLTAAIVTRDADDSGNLCETLTLETEDTAVTVSTRNAFRESWIELSK